MQPVLNIDDVKRVEVALTREGVSVAELMHRAGFAAAREALEFGGADNVVVLVGLGNNGGDGWVAAEALHERGVNVTVSSPIEPDALSGDLARQVDVKAHDIAAVVAEAHRREIVVETDDDFIGQLICRFFFTAAAGQHRSRRCGQHSYSR